MNTKQLKDKLFFCVLMGGLMMTSAWANTFSKVQARGTGCPLGSTDVIISPDGNSVSLLFNEMLVELPNIDGNNDNDVDIPGHGRANRFDRNVVQKICNILVESQLPEDHKVESIDVKIDFRGSTFMDEGANAFFHSQLINMTTPGRGSEARRDFVARKIWREGPVDEDWTVSSSRSIKVNGNCSKRGDDKNRFNLRNIVRAGLSDHAAAMDSMVYIGLDSADLVGKMEIKVNTRSCRGNSRPPRRDPNPRPPRNPRNPPRGGQVTCAPGLFFHPPANRCLSRREIVLWMRSR